MVGKFAKFSNKVYIITTSEFNLIRMLTKGSSFIDGHHSSLLVSTKTLLILMLLLGSQLWIASRYRGFINQYHIGLTRAKLENLAFRDSKSFL